MRRRSERKKSTEVSSPAPVSRRVSRRARKTPETKIEKVAGTPHSNPIEENVNQLVQVDETKEYEDQALEPFRKSRSQTRLTAKDSSSPAKRKSRTLSHDSRADSIKEENFVEGLDKVELVKEHERDVAETTITPDTNLFNQKRTEDSLKPLDVLEIRTEDNDGEKLHKQYPLENKNKVEGTKCVDNLENKSDTSQEQADHSIANETPDTEKESTDKSVARPPTINTVNNPIKQRKRKWITKKNTETKIPIVSISTDSLKNLISDVHPVPLSDIHLESSSEVEEIPSEREEGEETPTPEREVLQLSSINSEKIKHNLSEPVNATSSINKQRSPSPPHNKTSNILYITNLVRPFTVLQLKGLLVRTGKIVEDGFWIDRIKSKCFVQYENEDEAIETRHALHGVRWPVSNPKCLNVDFGLKVDMDRAIQSSKDELSHFGQENHKDNLIIGTGWHRDRNGEDKKNLRPVREWDVGKKENLERDKIKDTQKRRSRERDITGTRESDRNGKDRKARSKGREDQISSSLSPARKVKKKENEPPLRLLDDLFRKTKATPSIYWLPLTPEQIAEKEAFRQKRLEEHKQRVKQREMKKGKEREKDRNKIVERNREREHRRKRSSDRRSRSRDRRRY